MPVAHLAASTSRGSTGSNRSRGSNVSTKSQSPFERMMEMRDGKSNNPLKWRKSPCTTLSEANWFEQFILVVILLNSVWIGVDMEMNKEGSLYIGFDSFEVFTFVENVFCFIFSFEIFVRLFAYRRPWFYFTDPDAYGWNIFDFILVALMVVELWVFSTPMAPFDLDKHRAAHQGDGEAGAMASLASFRLLRLLRISRMVRVLRMVPELAIMVKSMAAATRGVASTLVLAGGLLYVYSVIFTQWAMGHANYEMHTRFGNLGASFMSFIQVMVYDDAFTVIRETFKADSFMGFLLICFIIIGGFTVLNMLIGVIVEIVQDTQAREQDTMLLQKIASVFDKLDEDGNGKLSRSEFEHSLDTLEGVGVPRETCALAIDFLDEDEVDLNEFVDLIFKLLRPIEAQDVVQVSATLGKLCESQGLAAGPVIKVMDMDDEEENDLRAQLGPEMSIPESVIPVSTFGGQTTISAWVSEDGKLKGKKKKKDESGEALADADLLKERGFCQWIVRKSWFGNVILGVICLNAMWIGVDLELNDVTKDHGDGLLGVEDGDTFIARLLHGMSFFGLVENIFCIIFTFEISCRFFGYRKMRFFFLDPTMWKWNLFDLVLVSLMIFENWVIPVMDLDNSNVKIFSIFRLLRLLRISRIIRTSPELATMVKSLAAAGRSVGSTMALLMGLIYVTAIIMTQWGQGQPHTTADDDDWDTKGELFGHIHLSSLTLLQMLVFDDSFSIIRHVLKSSTGMGILAIVFMIGGAFTVLNMLIGVICEIVSTTKKNEEERIMKLRVKDLFSQFDADLSGTITRDEYEGRRDLIDKIGLDPETCRIAFDLSDSDGTGALQLNEFMTMCFKLTKAPEAHDVLMIKKNIRRLATKLGAHKALEIGNLTKQHTQAVLPAVVPESSKKSKGSKGSKKKKEMAEGDLPGIMVVASSHSQKSKESKTKKK